MAAEAMILTGVRTPIGAMNGVLSTVPAPELGAVSIKQALKNANVEPERVDEILMGNVVTAGIGQNPARQAALRAGLPPSVGATTVNKVCGSGLKTVMLASQAIRLGDANVVVAGGMENMSLAPYLLTRARQGYRMGHGELLDAMIADGLWDVYGNKHMGTYGDQCAAKCNFTKEEQDTFAVRSFTRARKAVAEGVFKEEIVPVPITVKKATTLVAEDEGPARFDEAKLRSLKPAFGEKGTITAGNASSINDGAAALVLASDRTCQTRNLKPIARRRDGDVQPRAGMVHAGPHWRAAQGARPGRLVCQEHRSVRDQRGLRRGHNGRGARPGDSAREGQHLRRRSRARPSHRL